MVAREPAARRRERAPKGQGRRRMRRRNSQANGARPDGPLERGGHAAARGQGDGTITLSSDVQGVSAMGTALDLRLAARIGRLGTETAFAVSAEANEWKALGHTVYPFHLGDMDLPTPQNIVDAAEKAIRDGKTGYCPNAGIMPLREALAADVGASHGLELGPENVAIEPGGKPVIGKFILALMDPGDEVLYPTPGTPSTRARSSSTAASPSRTATCPAPRTSSSTGTRSRRRSARRPSSSSSTTCRTPPAPRARRPSSSASRSSSLANDLLVLCDEAYWDIRYSGQQPVAGFAARHGRALRHPVHVQQEVRHDRLAPGRRRRAGARSSTSSPSSTSTTRAAPTTSCSTAPSRASPATSRARGRSCGSSGSAATPPSTS